MSAEEEEEELPEAAAADEAGMQTPATVGACYDVYVSHSVCEWAYFASVYLKGGVFSLYSIHSRRGGHADACHGMYVGVMLAGPMEWIRLLSH